MNIPQSVNIEWARRMMIEAGKNHDRLCEGMCYSDFFEAYPELLDTWKEMIEATETPRAMHAYRLYASNLVNLDWLKRVIMSDKYSSRNNLYTILDRVKGADDELDAMYERLKSEIPEQSRRLCETIRLGGI